MGIFFRRFQLLNFLIISGSCWELIKFSFQLLLNHVLFLLSWSPCRLWWLSYSAFLFIYIHFLGYDKVHRKSEQKGLEKSSTSTFYFPFMSDVKEASLKVTTSGRVNQNSCLLYPFPPANCVMKFHLTFGWWKHKRNYFKCKTISSNLRRFSRVACADLFTLLENYLFSLESA